METSIIYDPFITAGDTQEIRDDFYVKREQNEKLFFLKESPSHKERLLFEILYRGGSFLLVKDPSDEIRQAIIPCVIFKNNEERELLSESFNQRESSLLELSDGTLTNRTSALSLLVSGECHDAAITKSLERTEDSYDFGTQSIRQFTRPIIGFLKSGKMKRSSSCNLLFNRQYLFAVGFCNKMLSLISPRFPLSKHKGKVLYSAIRKTVDRGLFAYNIFLKECIGRDDLLERLRYHNTPYLKTYNWLISNNPDILKRRVQFIDNYPIFIPLLFNKSILAAIDAGEKIKNLPLDPSIKSKGFLRRLHTKSWRSIGAKMLQLDLEELVFLGSLPYHLWPTNRNEWRELGCHFMEERITCRNVAYAISEITHPFPFDGISDFKELLEAMDPNILDFISLSNKDTFDFKKMTLKSIHKASKAWHNHDIPAQQIQQWGENIQSTLKKISGVDLSEISTWPRILKDNNHSKYTFRELTSQYELVVEGNEMNHCVGRLGYASSCKRKYSRIFSISADGVRTTLEVKIVQDDGRFSVVKLQHYAYDDIAPPSSSDLAAQVLVEELSRSQNQVLLKEAFDSCTKTNRMPKSPNHVSMVSEWRELEVLRFLKSKKIINIDITKISAADFVNDRLATNRLSQEIPDADNFITDDAINF